MPYGPSGSSHFHTTHWSVVRAAALSTADSRDALGELCSTYWRPVYGFIRRRGHDVHDARDLTQGFFASFLERGDVAGVDPSHGRFRSYLLAAVKHFLANEKERERALKRGGGVGFLPLSFDDEAGPGIEPADARTPEADFEREWALAVLRRALERLKEEQEKKERGVLFARLKPSLDGGEIPGGYAAVAAELGLTTVAVKVTAHRLKKRYRKLLIEEVARTVEGPQEVDDELRELFRALEG